MSGLILACFLSTETLVLADIFKKLVGEKWCGARYWKLALLLPGATECVVSTSGIFDESRKYSVVFIG